MRALAVLVLATAPAAAEPARCMVTRIKDKAVALDVLVTASGAFCRTGAQRIAKRYAAAHPVCDDRETTFTLVATWGAETYELRSYCPPLARAR